MRKYLFIAKTQLMSNLQYIFTILFSFLNYFIMLFILLQLWKYLYSDPNALINGYTMHQMVWYVIITELLWMTLGGRKLSRKVSEDVKSGNVAYNINKPYHYVLYCLFSHLGDIVIKGILFSLLGIIIGYLFLGSFPNISIISISLVIITAIMATIISTLFITSLSLLSFFIEDASPFYWVYSKVILVLGTIFPIEYFPLFMQKILKYSPVYVVSYGPAKLFVDFHIKTALSILISQCVYIILLFILSNWLYKKGVKKINVNGG